MENNTQDSWPVFGGDDVVLITHADCDIGYWRARELLSSGCRVVVTARQVTALTRILLGEKYTQIMAVAADIDDATQYTLLAQRAQDRFGRLSWVLDGRSGALTALCDNTSEYPAQTSCTSAGAAERLMPIPTRRRSNRKRIVARIGCDPKAADTSHMSSLASG